MADHSGSTQTHTHHTVDYIEFTVRDLAQAQAFYESAFGWRFTAYGPEYAGVTKPDGSAEFGGFAVGEPKQGGLLVLLFSEDLDASVAAVQAAGGAVVQGPYDFPGGRRFHFTDPSGNELGVWSE